MKRLRQYLPVLLAAVVCCMQIGCVSERKLAKQQDLTPHIIRQASDWIAADPELSRFPIVIDGFKGNMRLKGNVNTERQKIRAAQLVWSARGVRSVENDLKLAR